MEAVLRDAFAHEAWANKTLIAFIRELTPEQRRATAPGAYGGMADTLRHHLDAAAWYQCRLGLERLAWEAEDLHTDDPDELDRRADEVEARWERIFEGPFDAERVLEPRPDVLPPEHTPAGVFIAQVLNHGSEHRGQTSTILTTLGIDPPELDVWAYAYATGRIRVDPTPTD